ncbi:MAG: hypothetical protein AB1847_22590 [bacterium]
MSTARDMSRAVVTVTQENSTDQKCIINGNMNSMIIALPTAIPTAMADDPTIVVMMFIIMPIMAIIAWYPLGSGRVDAASELSSITPGAALVGPFGLTA